MIATTNAPVAAPEFAEAMSTLASGVVLVTCRLDERPWGMTVTAFASVSAYPPTVLVSLSSESAGARAIAATGAFGVSILSLDQVEVAKYGAAPGAAKFLDAFVEPCDRQSTSPAIANTLAHLDCVVIDAVDAGDHTVFFGHVHTVRGRRRGEPLLYHSRGYGSFFAPRTDDRKELEMTFELTAKTEPGERLVALAETLADEIGGRASKHDREASFPHESLAAIRTSGYLAAPIPAELGGLGVGSLHDVLVASSRLARGDAALTLGVNMHLVFLVNVVRLWQVATASGDQRRAAAFGATIQQIAHDGTVFASAVSEPQQDLTRPATTATRTETGWTISGRKIFCTMSPAADVLYTAVTYTEDGRRERYGYAMVPRDTPGVVVHDDWDAMGMRASGSHSVSFEDVRVPASALRGGFSTGDATGYLERNLSAGLFHAAAAIGIAESAHTTAVSRLAVGTGLEPHTQMLVAENIVDLSACRAVFARAASLIDEHYLLNPAARGTSDELTRLFGEAQSAKLFVGGAAIRIVDRALAMSGGAGYLNGSPLARAYRDVRAMPFMHPLGANRGYVFVGQLATRQEPTLH